MTRFPNPFTALTQMFTKAFATLADRNGPASNARVVGFSHSKARRSSRGPTSQAPEVSTTTQATRKE